MRGGICAAPAGAGELPVCPRFFPLAHELLEDHRAEMWYLDLEGAGWPGAFAPLDTDRFLHRAALTAGYEVPLRSASQHQHNQVSRCVLDCPARTTSHPGIPLDVPPRHPGSKASGF